MLLNFSKVVVTDHWAIMIDININSYFTAETSEFDAKSISRFDLRR